MTENLPKYEDRRKILARDPLCCADGFRVLCRLVLRHLFGVRVCPYCPDCNSDRWSGPACQDRLGSSATAVGGVFGRVDAYFGSIENQKAGAFHLHCQLFVQCMHQHTPLLELFQIFKKKKSRIAEEYLAYTNHVSKASYNDIDEWKARRPQREADWPEYPADLELISKPGYISADSWMHEVAGRAPSNEEYAKQYRFDVHRIQECRQHHVHIPDEEGNRKPLTHCKRKDGPRKCKANFPKSGEMCLTQPAVICRGLAAKCDLPVKGARNAFGLLERQAK